MNLPEDRYAVVEVLLDSGNSRTVGLYLGDEGAEQAHAHALRISGDGHKGFVVGL